MSADHVAQDPDSHHDQHKKLQKSLCNYIINNLPKGEASSLMPSVISEQIPSGMKVCIPSAFLTCPM